MENELHMPPERLEKAKAAPDAAAPIALTQENGIALSDAELDKVAGGWPIAPPPCPSCLQTDQVFSDGEPFYCRRCKCWYSADGETVIWKHE